MSRIKKTLSLVIILVLSMQIWSVPVSVTAATVTNEYDMLIAVGILNENVNLASSSGKVSRAGLVKAVVDIYLGGLSGAISMTDSVYSDVKENTAFRNEILFANQLGFISNAENFRPDDDITYAEAIKILVSALGYRHEAAYRGGFPAGYGKVARNIGLTDEITAIGNEDALDFMTFYKLLYNAAVRCDIAEIYSVTGSGDDFKITYAAVKGKKLLTEKFHVYETEGIVTANKYATLAGASATAFDIIEIGNEMYYVNDKIDVTNALGYYANVWYHYDESSGVKTAVYLEVDEKENSTIVLDAENRGEGSDSDKIYYYKNERRKTVDVSRTAAMIYNHGWVRFNESYLYPENGTVTLIDNNNDNKIDVVKVMNYETFVVDSVISAEGIITNAFGGDRIELDATDKEYDFVLLKNGKKLSMDNISQYNIISYAESTSGEVKLKTVLVSSAYVKGCAEGYLNGKIVINDKAYRMSDYMQKNIKLGSEGVFYLDAFDTIAFQETENGVLFGYLNNIAINKSMIFENAIKVQIFSEYGRFVELNLKDKIRFNNAKVEASDFYNTVNMDLAGNRQLIEYKVNRNNEVTSINFAENVTLGTQDEEAARESGKFRLSKSISSATYRGGGFDDLLKKGEQTKIFFVPDQSVTEADLSDFYIGNLTVDSNYKNIKAYNMDAYLVPEILVITESASSKHYDRTPTVFDHQIQMLGNNDEIATGIKCWQSGELCAYPVLDDSDVLAEIKALEKGDVGRLSFNHKGEITGFDLWFNKSAGFEPMASGSVYGTSEAYAVADVIEIDYQNKRMVLNYNGYRAGTFTTPTVYIYDLSRDRISVGDIYDVKKGSKIFTTTGYLNLGTMIVFEN